MFHLIRRNNSENYRAFLLEKLLDEAIDLSDHGAVLALGRSTHDARQVDQSQVGGTRGLDLEEPNIGDVMQVNVVLAQHTKRWKGRYAHTFITIESDENECA